METSDINNVITVGAANDPFNENYKHVAGCRGIWGKDFLCVAADENVFRLLNCFKQRPLTEFIVEKDRERFLKWWNELEVGEFSKIEILMRRGDGEEREAFLFGRRIINKNGESDVNLEIVDIFEAAEKYGALNADYAKVTSYLEHLEGCEFEYDSETKKLIFFRYLRGERVEEKNEEFLEIIPEFNAILNNLVGTPDFIHETIHRDDCNFTADGVVIYQEYVMNSIYGRIRKNNERIDDETVAENTASDKLDTFTGLWNKVSALDYLRERIDSGDKHQIIVAMIDLDYFKMMNDTYGHAFGDEVILRMAQILKSVVGGRGIAARFGGDEFMLVLEDIGTETALRSILESTRTQLSWAFNDRVKGQQISCTIGIAEYPRNGVDFDTIFNKADRALYIGKQKGKNRYIIYKEHIHGELPKGDAISLEQGIRDSLKVGEHLKGISWCLSLLCKSGSAAIKTVAEKLMLMYNVDRVSVYSGQNLELLEHYGDYAAPLDNLLMVKKPDYMNLFDEDGHCHIVFNHMISEFYEEFHGVLHKNGIYETHMFLIGSKRRTRGIICFDRLHIDNANSRKWSNEELHMLLVVAKLMGDLIV